MVLTLSGKTQKGKNRIREHSNKWQVVRESDSVVCLKGAAGFLIMPVFGSDSKLEKAIRWIAKQHDTDFDICQII